MYFDRQAKYAEGSFCPGILVHLSMIKFEVPAFVGAVIDKRWCLRVL